MVVAVPNGSQRNISQTLLLAVLGLDYQKVCKLDGLSRVTWTQELGPGPSFSGVVVMFLDKPSVQSSSFLNASRLFYAAKNIDKAFGYGVNMKSSVNISNGRLKLWTNFRGLTNETRLQ